MFFKRKPAAKNAEVVSTSESSALTLNGLSLSSLPDPIPSDKVFSFGKLNGELLRQVLQTNNLASINVCALQINAENDAIHDITSILPNLTTLSLNTSSINIFRDLSLHSTSLRVLSLDNCDLSEIDGVAEAMPSLVSLSIQGNMIDDIMSLAYHSTLTTLNLAYNKLSDPDLIDWLASIPKLTTLTLFPNPICAYDNYREYVLGKIPTLEELDGEKVIGGHSSADDIGDKDEDKMKQITTLIRSYRRGDRSMAKPFSTNYTSSTLPSDASTKITTSATPVKPASVTPPLSPSTASPSVPSIPPSVPNTPAPTAPSPIVAAPTIPTPAATQPATQSATHSATQPVTHTQAPVEAQPMPLAAPVIPTVAPLVPAQPTPTPAPVSSPKSIPAPITPITTPSTSIPHTAPASAAAPAPAPVPKLGFFASFAPHALIEKQKQMQLQAQQSGASGSSSGSGAFGTSSDAIGKSSMDGSGVQNSSGINNISGNVTTRVRLNSASNISMKERNSGGDTQRSDMDDDDSAMEESYQSRNSVPKRALSSKIPGKEDEVIPDPEFTISGSISQKFPQNATSAPIVRVRPRPPSTGTNTSTASSNAHASNIKRTNYGDPSALDHMSPQSEPYPTYDAMTDYPGVPGSPLSPHDPTRAVSGPPRRMQESGNFPMGMRPQGITRPPSTGSVASITSANGPVNHPSLNAPRLSNGSNGPMMLRAPIPANMSRPPSTGVTPLGIPPSNGATPLGIPHSSGGTPRARPLSNSSGERPQPMLRMGSNDSGVAGSQSRPPSTGTMPPGMVRQTSQRALPPLIAPPETLRKNSGTGFSGTGTGTGSGFPVVSALDDYGQSPSMFSHTSSQLDATARMTPRANILGNSQNIGNTHTSEFNPQYTNAAGSVPGYYANERPMQAASGPGPKPNGTPVRIRVTSQSGNPQNPGNPSPNPNSLQNSGKVSISIRTRPRSNGANPPPSASSTGNSAQETQQPMQQPRQAILQQPRPQNPPSSCPAPAGSLPPQYAAYNNTGMAPPANFTSVQANVGPATAAAPGGPLPAHYAAAAQPQYPQRSPNPQHTGPPPHSQPHQQLQRSSGKPVVRVSGHRPSPPPSNGGHPGNSANVAPVAHAAGPGPRNGGPRGPGVGSNAGAPTAAAGPPLMRSPRADAAMDRSVMRGPAHDMEEVEEDVVSTDMGVFGGVSVGTHVEERPPSAVLSHSSDGRTVMNANGRKFMVRVKTKPV